jgi:hypothetical protein
VIRPTTSDAHGSVAFAFAGLDDVGGRFWIDDVRRDPLADDVGGQQTFDGGKASQVAQKVPAFPGSTISSVTSTHGVTR